jgi:hypothetical protein
MPMAMPTYAPVVRVLSGDESDAAAGVGEGLSDAGEDVLLVGVVVVAMVLLELDGMILV